MILLNEGDHSNYDDDKLQINLKDLIEITNTKSMKSSIRITILFILALNKELTFSQLLESLKIGKGSLKNHIALLESDGYVKERYIITIRGPRLLYEITENGMQIYKKFLNLLEKSRKQE